MEVVGNRKVFYLLSGALFLVSIAAMIVWGLKFGIDFTGGSLIEIEFASARPTVSDLTADLSRMNLGETRIQPTGDRGVLIRTRHMSEAEHQALLGALGSGAGEKRFDTVGPTIGSELRTRSVTAIFLVMILIVSYIAFAFRKVSQPIASWKYGIATVVALVHDVIIPAGFFAILGHYFGFEVDTLFATAVLTILGFSVHDTIVVFDRIRENLKREPGMKAFGALVNQSVNETFVRSINTSLTVALALAAVNFFGGESTRVFSLTLLAGIITGTYSSIFIASPLLVSWHEFQTRPR